MNLPSRSPSDTLPLVRAARLLGLSWGQAWRRTLTGELEGEQDARGRWFVTDTSVRRVLGEQKELEHMGPSV